MIKLIVIADDLTGALDTGVQFAKVGISTIITTVGNLGLPKDNRSHQVLVVDLESRHLSPEEAMRLVKATAIKYEAQYYYKKTDSGMRGNIGAELEGLLIANQDNTLVFVPAFPETGRTTSEGIHYDAGIPISKSVFGDDPFEPVKRDYIPDIIALQSAKQVTVVSQDKLMHIELFKQVCDILVFDAVNDKEMKKVADAVIRMGPPKLMAGCAGFAQYLPYVLGLKPNLHEEYNLHSKGMIVLSGSINRTTLRQVAHAEKAGFTVIELRPEDKLTENLADSSSGERLLEQIANAHNFSHRVVVQATISAEHIQQTNDLAQKKGLSQSQTRQLIATNLGRIAAKIIQSGIDTNLIVFGGDTLIAVIESVSGGRLVPIREIVSGVVLSTVNYQGRSMNLITKSGGFGDENVLTIIDAYLT